VFQSRCGAGHGVGKGDAVGPDLAGVTTRRDRDRLVRYLRHPDQVWAEKDPIAVSLAARFKRGAHAQTQAEAGPRPVLAGLYDCVSH